jgi:hypothetical protein
MFKRLTTTIGMVLLASSFAFAGQAPTKPAEQPRATKSMRGHSSATTAKTAKTRQAKKHVKNHKKEQAPTTIKK